MAYIKEAAMIGVGLIGFGYWGPNFARVFSLQRNCRLVSICDLDDSRLRLAAQIYPYCQMTKSYSVLLDHPEIQLILVATPVHTHFQLGKDALLAGKDVLISKPMTNTVEEAVELNQLADEKGRILSVDHVFLYAGAVQKVKEIVDSGEFGDLLYFDSVRVNLGLFQQDVNVIYDLAPHDLSILGFLTRKNPVSVQAMGASHAHDLENLAYVHLEYDNNFVAHLHLNWLAPVKIRRILIGGTRKMIVFDDTEPSEKVKVYDSGVVIKEGDVNSIYKVRVDYRTGDMVAPKLVHKEALVTEAEHILDCVRNRTRSLSSGVDGLNVVKVLEAVQQSLKSNGIRVALEDL